MNWEPSAANLDGDGKEQKPAGAKATDPQVEELKAQVEDRREEERS